MQKRNRTSTGLIVFFHLYIIPFIVLFFRDRVYNPAAHMVSGALAGGIAAAITTPLDVCKTLLNTQQTGKASGMVEAVRTVYRLRGVSGYFRGRC